MRVEIRLAFIAGKPFAVYCAQFLRAISLQTFQLALKVPADRAVRARSGKGQLMNRLCRIRGIPNWFMLRPPRTATNPGARIEPRTPSRKT